MSQDPGPVRREESGTAVATTEFLFSICRLFVSGLAFLFSPITGTLVVATRGSP